ncbi:MAG: twin-arginine translocase TatA/TatE family subunit [Chloroflexia bacterium]
MPELLLILVVALVVVGPDRIPEAARTLGKGIGDLKRAMEPARSAWKDLTSEITSVTSEVQGAVRSTTNSITGSIKPTEKGAVTTAIPTENPWTVHPIMEGMTAEERVKFMEGGEIPPRIQADLAAKQVASANGGGYTPEVVDLDYPMPHTTVKYQPAPAFFPEVEDLAYPKPGNTTPTQSEETT